MQAQQLCEDLRHYFRKQGFKDAVVEYLEDDRQSFILTTRQDPFYNPHTYTKNRVCYLHIDAAGEQWVALNYSFFPAHILIKIGQFYEGVFGW